VSDEGPGLPNDLGDRIFEPFVTTKEAGIGIGLTLSRRIVESHGGSLEAASLVPNGAEFCVRLPADEMQ
jgi:C4-dicarboxylate-specific signal transduction histidine kinase